MSDFRALLFPHHQLLSFLCKITVCNAGVRMKLSVFETRSESCFLEHYYTVLHVYVRLYTVFRTSVLHGKALFLLYF